jgi:hypothetical protein
VQTPYIFSLSVSGWVHVNVNGLSSGKFAVNGEVGTVVLAGELDSLLVNGGQLMLNAAQLKVPQIVSNLGFGGTIVYQEQAEVVSNGEGRAYTADTYPKRSEAELTQVSFTLYNPSLKRIQLYVRGPREQSFSYGFPLGPKAKRREHWPVGTRVYTSPLGSGALGKLLYEVTPATAGQTISLER